MRIVLLILSAVFIQQSVFATLTEKNGFYVTMQDDTVYGKLKVRIDYLDELFYARIQYRAFFEDSLGNLITLKPDEIKCFSFFHKYEHLKFVSQEFYNGYRLFLHAINEEGAVKLYVHYKNVVDTRTNYGNLAFYLLELPASSERDYFFLTKQDSTTLKYSKYSGKKHIAKFFKDYPVLYSKIERGLYGYTAVYKMVREYNLWYKSRKSVSSIPQKK